MHKTTSRERPLLPASRAFVVQLGADAELARGRWVGRVEHVVSGRSTHFRSLDGLLAFFAQAGTGEAARPSASRDREEER